MVNDLLGKILCGRYRVDQFLGRGGMAEVYKVWDMERATFLAMKILREDLAEDRIFLRRFSREANTLARLQHPNIVRFYGLDQDGLLVFILMDFIAGSSLRTEIFKLNGQMMPVEKMREVLHPICSALHFAHRQGLVHCDLKPSNILIHQNGAVLVTDFGIARMTDAATATMAGAGTPAYMSPEQARGLDPTPQSDIYSLGIVLYEMLTGGERPFTGEHADTTGTTGEKVRWEQVHLAPPSPRQYNPAISRGLEAVVMKCLAKKPAERWQTPLDLLNGFERAVSRAQEVVPGSVAPPGPLPVVKSEPAEAKPVVTPPRQAASVEPPAAAPVKEARPSAAPWLLAGSLGVIGLAGVVGLAVLMVNLLKPDPTPAPVAEVPMIASTTAEPTQIPVQIAAEVPAPTSPPTEEPTVEQTLVPTLEIGSTMHSEKDGMEMVYVPAGEFRMGSTDGASDEQPVHKVYLDGYWIDKYEVTNARYAKCVADGNCDKPDDTKFYQDANYADHPVVYVSWFDARDYCAWVGRRLPSEAEWEKAARGTEGRTYPWGDASPSARLLNYNGNQGDTTAVGSYPGGASPYGALDMAGNVWEWVADWYDEDYYSKSPEANPSGPASGGHRVLRGGSWSTIEWYVRAAYRCRSDPDYAYNNYGFRCVASQAP